MFGSKNRDMLTFEFASCYMLTVLPICVAGWTLDRFLWEPLSFVSRCERYDIPQADRYAKAGLLSGVSDTGRYWSCTTVKHFQIHSLALSSQCSALQLILVNSCKNLFLTVTYMRGFWYCFRCRIWERVFVHAILTDNLHRLI